MKFIFTFLFFIITFFSFTQNLKKGIWHAQLKLNNKDVLPFTLKVDKNNQITILNGEENIKLEKIRVENDSLRVRFPFFNSEIVFISTKKRMTGYWVNYQRSENYKIPFYAEKVKRKSPRFLTTKQTKNSLDIDGNGRLNLNQKRKMNILRWDYLNKIIQPLMVLF